MRFAASRPRSATLFRPAPWRRPMRVVVTGVQNPYGQAIVRALAGAGHHVRAFGTEVGSNPFADLDNVQPHPGRIEVVGSIEPVLSQREALVHAACLDAPGKDRQAHAFKIERGTLGCRYGAEREMLDHFVHVTPAHPARLYAKVQEQAMATAQATRGPINVAIIRAEAPDATAAEVLRRLESLPERGYLPGANDAITV
jgi:NAD(P)-dependent dehydrogenase (short-subunit alcohol dehydrogenase family)